MKRIIMLASLVAVIFATGCGHEAKEEGAEHHHHADAKYLVTSPLRKDTSIVNDYVCQVHSIRNIEVRALERGYLQKILVDEGQHVKEGQLLFQIMPRLYQAEVQKAQAEMDLARIELENTKLLADSGIVSPNELAMARANFEKAKAELSLAEVHLGFTEIRAPFDGIIDRLRVRQGSLIDEGELLTTLSDNSKMWVYFNVSEPEYLDYSSNMKADGKTPVRLQMANNRIFKETGVIETIEAEFNNETGNIPFRATFSNPDGLLRHGETGNILVDVPLKNALLIPQKATYEILDKKYVFVIDENNVIHSRQIDIGEEMPHLYEVKSGLSENEIILLEGLRKVRDNEKIQYEFQEPKKVLAELIIPAE